MIDVSEIDGFEWDKGNIDKNQKKHRVSIRECEMTFFNQPVVLFDDEVHSQQEKRFGLYGETDAGRALTLFFTVRRNHIRIISARDQSKRERGSYQARKYTYFQQVKKGA